MSNPLAIAAVTMTLRNLLDRVKLDLPDTDITTKPAGKARENEAKNQINLFLYHVMPNPAYRNMDLRNQVMPGETGQPPLALDLFFLLTAYGKGSDDTLGQTALGRAMSILHDHPLLDREEIRNALAGSGLQDQLERIRITLHPLSVDDLFRLWSTFQTDYRISVAYQVSVLLIESQRPVRTPLPVLERTVTALPRATPLPGFAEIEQVILPNNQSFACLGDTVTVRGYRLTGDTVKVNFATTRLEQPVKLDPQPGGTAIEIEVVLPGNAAALAQWPAGLYRLWVEVTQAGETQVTNEFPFTLAPRIQSIIPNPASYGGAGQVTLTVTCQPQVWPEQSALLLLGQYRFSPQPHPTKTGTLNYVVKSVPTGDYFARLRMDGVDSPIIDFSQTPPVFDETKKVRIRP